MVYFKLDLVPLFFSFFLFLKFLAHAVSSFAQVGVTGYCMGGALSIASAVLVPEVNAVVAFYGVPSSELADPSQAKAPVQAHFGEIDNYVGFSDISVLSSFTHLSFFMSVFERQVCAFFI